MLEQIEYKIDTGNKIIRILRYRPRLFKQFYINLEKNTIQRRIRFFLEYIKGYNVYYLEINDEIVGYSVISKGGGRYHFADRQDIVVGPYFIKEEHRGKKYSELLIGELLSLLNYRYAYDWIAKTNIPSFKCSAKVGFQIIGTANLMLPFRRIQICNSDNGDYYILRFKKNKMVKE